MEDIERWIQPTQPKATLPSESAQNKIAFSLHPDTRPSIATSWASCFNAVINKHLNANAASATTISVLCFGNKPQQQQQQQQMPVQRASFSYYAVVEKVRKTHRVALCKLEGDPGAQRIVLQRPLQFSLTVQVIASHWKAVQNGANVTVFLLPTEAPTEGPQHLGNLGGAQPKSPSPSARPIQVAILQKPSKKTAAKLQKGLLPHDSADGGDAGANQAVGECEAPAAAVCDEDEGKDNQLQEGMNLLLEEAEAEGAVASVDSVDDGSHDECLDEEEGLLQFAVRNICLETTMNAADELEATSSEIAENCRRETHEELASNMEHRKAQDAVKGGIAIPNPTDAEVRQMGLDGEWQDGGAENDEEAFMEVVLNQAGRGSMKRTEAGSMKLACAGLVNRL